MRNEILRNFFFQICRFGDELLIQQKYKLVPAKVTNVSSVTMEGKHWY